MVEPDYSQLVARHRAYFQTGCTHPEAWREAQLRALIAMIEDHHDEFYDAMWTDLRPNRGDADLADIEYCGDEARHNLEHFRNWMKPEAVHTPLALQPGRVDVRHDPLGVALIIGAWNYPFMLILAPLAAAIAAGNVAVLKPSEIAEACRAVLARRVPEYLDPQAFSVVLGAVPETTA